MYKQIGIALLLVGLAFPIAGAHGDNVADCDAPSEETLLTQDLGDDTFYVTDSGVFQESNGEAGLQSTDGSCDDDDDETEPHTWGADDRIL